MPHGSYEAHRTDAYHPRLLPTGDPWPRNRVPPQQRWRHRVRLIVVRAVGEYHAFLEEVHHPRSNLGVGQKYIPGLDQRAIGRS